MSGLVESLIRKLREHACRFAGLEEVTVPSAAADDSDIEHSNDLRYMNELLEDIAGEFAQLWRRICDAPSSEDVMWLQFLRHNAEWWPERTFSFDWPGPDVEAALDGVGVELERWRQGLLAQRRFHRWWLSETQRDNDAMRAAA